MKIVVIANHHRDPLIETYLRDIEHATHFCEDYDIPQGAILDTGLVNNHIGAFRCFKGHQDALAIELEKNTKENILVLEDDAVPNTVAWLDICHAAELLTTQFKYVSLHTRQFDLAKYEKRDIDATAYYVPMESGLWAVATLAYVLSPEACREIIGWSYTGIPLDVLIYTTLGYCVVSPSPFDHNRSGGSLIDGV